jgi:Methylase involved in ubiquinone/menaquinone biosynthesis
MKINYDEISEKYDIDRNVNPDTLKRLISGAQIVKDSVVSDFGCGTGNYACAIKRVTDSIIYGIEPSDGMRYQAVQKNKDIIFMKGNHKYIPIPDGAIDFIYMTDVMHHIPDISQMFIEFRRILKENGRVCIVTESYKQLKNRFWVKYFPSTVQVEKERYPDISEIVYLAEINGFVKVQIDSSDRYIKHAISMDFMKLVENKGFSMFRLISDEDYHKGFDLLKQDFERKVELSYFHGETFIWLKKPEIQF